MDGLGPELLNMLRKDGKVIIENVPGLGPAEQHGNGQIPKGEDYRAGQELLEATSEGKTTAMSFITILNFGRQVSACFRPLATASITWRQGDQQT